MSAELRVIGEMDSNVTGGYICLVKQSHVTAPKEEVSPTN